MPLGLGLLSVSSVHCILKSSQLQHSHLPVTLTPSWQNRNQCIEMCGWALSEALCSFAFGFRKPSSSIDDQENDNVQHYSITFKQLLGLGNHKAETCEQRQRPYSSCNQQFLPLLKASGQGWNIYSPCLLSSVGSLNCFFCSQILDTANKQRNSHSKLVSGAVNGWWSHHCHDHNYDVLWSAGYAMEAADQGKEASVSISPAIWQDHGAQQ